MDLEERINLLTRNASEVITAEDARAVLQGTDSPKGYIGVEPSGLFHVGWVIWVNKFKDLVEAGVRMTLFEATWHAWVNDKFGGDMGKIALCAEYIEHCLRALGVDLSRVSLIRADQLVADKAYWEGLLRIAKELSLSRIKRAVTIMGRKEDEVSVDFSKLIYPCMQVEDIFYLDLDICLGGMDQRRAHVLAREVAESRRLKKPVAVHTPLLPSLQGAGRMDVAGEEAAAACKMSKSKPETCIFIHDSPEVITAKIASAYCPAREAEGNPVIDIARYVLMHGGGLTIKRPAKYGGDLFLESPAALLDAYRGGSIHPLDLKNSVSEGLQVMLGPVREYFHKVSAARDVLERLSAPAE